MTAPNAPAIQQPAITTQPNGKVLVTVVRDKEIKVARLRRNGKLDRRFGERGFAPTGLGQRAIAMDMIVGPSGTIDLTAQFSGQSRYPVPAVIQLTKDGKLDPEFGVDGLVHPFAGHSVMRIGGLALGADGRLLVAADAGTAQCVGVPTGEPCVYTRLVASLGADGRLDPAFGDSGLAAVPLDGNFVELAVAPDGRIVTGAGGFYYLTSNVSRLTPEGSLDATLGGGAGYVQTTVPVTGVAVSPSGQIYAGGAYMVVAEVGDNSYKGSQVFGVTALGADGSPDPAFGDDGAFTRTLGSPTFGFGSLLLRDDGDLVLGGPVASHCRSPNPNVSSDSRCRLSAGLVALDSSGSPLVDFGDGGVVRVPISRSRAFFDATYGVQTVESRDGLRMATPVYYGHDGAAASGIAVAAIRDDGRLDRRYGKRGLRVVRIRD